MLNPFWWYCLAWSAQLILYDLRWADILLPMDGFLRIFIIATIVISAILGWIFRDRYKFSKLENNPHKNWWITILVLIGYAINFYCAKDVPFFSSVVLHTTTYDTFEGIKTFAPFLYTFTLFYCIYLIFIIFEFPSFRLGLEILVTALMPLLMMNRNFLLLIVLTFALAFLEHIEKKTLLKLIGLAFFSVLALYVFGGVGNLRSGTSWNDNSWMINFMGINERWPKWLSYQFVCAYSYITQGLNNFNNTIALGYKDSSFLKLALCFLPDFLVKRIGMAPRIRGVLIDKNMNTAVGYTGPYVHGSFLGMSMMFLGIIAVILIITWLDKKAGRPEFHNPVIMSLIYFSTMSFFADPFYYSGSIMLIFFSALYLLIAIIKNRRNGITGQNN